MLFSGRASGCIVTALAVTVSASCGGSSDSRSEPAPETTATDDTAEAEVPLCWGFGEPPDWNRAPSVSDAGGGEFVYGTDGDDRLVGTAADETICGNGGNDVIDGGGGGGGEDYIYAGTGDDEVVNAEWVFAGPGDDVVETGEAIELHGEGGDDILLATASTVAPSVVNPLYAFQLVGGDGNDVLVAPPTGDGLANGGAGSDVAVTLNLSTGINADTVDLDGESQLSADVGSGCTVSIPTNGEPPAVGPIGNVSCNIPWPRSLSGLDEVLSLAASWDGEKLTLAASLYDGLGKLSVSRWHDLTEFQASLPGDVCLCDPLVPLGTFPDPGDVLRPLDWST